MMSNPDQEMDFEEATSKLTPPKNNITITDDMYKEQFFPQIANSVKSILNHNGQPVPLVALYELVYNVCCQRHSQQLYIDFLKLMTTHVQQLQRVLGSTPPDNFLSTLTHIYEIYNNSVIALCKAFDYLERIYIREKLKSSLRRTLHLLFNTYVLQNKEIKPRLQSFLSNLQIYSDPSVLHALVTALYSIDKSYAQQYPEIFARYIPCLTPSRGLDQDIKETMQLIEHIRSEPEFSSPMNTNSATKRKMEVDS